MIAALTLRRLVPAFSVRLIRSPEIGVIGVGEGTFSQFPKYFIETLGLPAAELYAAAEPTWKLGIKFVWGSRGALFLHLFPADESPLAGPAAEQWILLRGDMENADVWGALMAAGKAFPRRQDGAPEFAAHQFVGFHIENAKLVSYLETQCRAGGVTFTEATVGHVERAGENVDALVLDTGERVAGDLFVDASGFRSEILGRALAEPYESFDRTLFCDRALIGGWPRTNEPLPALHHGGDHGCRLVLADRARALDQSRLRVQLAVHFR